MSGCVQCSRVRCCSLHSFHEEVQPAGRIHVLSDERISRVTCLSCDSHVTHLQCGRSVQQLEQKLCLVPLSLQIGAGGMVRRRGREEVREERGRRGRREGGRREGERGGRREEGEGGEERDGGEKEEREEERKMEEVGELADLSDAG